MKITEAGKEVITVAELIEQLQKLPPDAMVYAEGCDCVGPATGAELQSDGDVWIRR